jgi:hypothetical protein
MMANKYVDCDTRYLEGRKEKRKENKEGTQGR